MNIWALADFHLSFGTKNKSMEAFGKDWTNWTTKIKNNCERLVKDDDVLLIAGDISWAMKLPQAIVDLEWIDSLPGRKIISKGNHDHWWPSAKKLKDTLPPSIQALCGNAIDINENISIAGTRLWDSSEYNFNEVIDFKDNPLEKTSSISESEKKELDSKIFDREFLRLETSLKLLNPHAKVKIVQLHYPPIGLDLHKSKVHFLLKDYDITHCIFGHLHSLKTNKRLFGSVDGISYHLTSCDYLNFVPEKIYSDIA